LILQCVPFVPIPGDEKEFGSALKRVGIQEALEGGGNGAEKRDDNSRREPRPIRRKHGPQVGVWIKDLLFPSVTKIGG